ncbi:MAG: T9SS type A sorting domain-containing protein [Lewinellaceae bacterium]|nr:T9SS type A sorting domain-containing protein [Lewinellaceae bacterium]
MENALLQSNIRPGLEEGGALLSRLPEATLDSLMYWKSDCTEPGALAQAVLWRNGRRVVPDCGGEAARVGETPVSAKETEKAELAPIKLYPNPSQGTLTIELPVGYGPAIVIFYNLQGQTALKQGLSEGRRLINLPSGRFKPGVYLAELILSSGKRERFKLILTR